MFDPGGGWALIVSSPVGPPSTDINRQVEVGEGQTVDLGFQRTITVNENELLGLGEQIYQDLMPHLTPEQRKRLTQSREHVRARASERGLVNFDS